MIPRYGTGRHEDYLTWLDEQREHSCRPEEAAGERTEPYTAAEHAEAEGHGAQYARDVPKNCVCTWQWHPLARGYRRIRPWEGCPWHLAPRPDRDAGGLQP